MSKKVKDVFQIYRSFHYGNNIKSAYWDIDHLENGSLKVHFHADLAESTDWIAETLHELFNGVETEMANWVSAVEKLLSVKV